MVYPAKYRIFMRALAVILPLLVLTTVSQPVQAAPLISLSPASGTAGTEVTITGNNFGSFLGDNIYIFFDNIEVSDSPLIPQEETFTFAFNIPDGSSPGKHTIRVKDEDGSTLGEPVTFTISQIRITLDTTAGSVGSVVTISGEGFYASKTVTFYYHNRAEEKLGTEVASPTGEFSYHFTIPAGVAGEHKIKAENTQDDLAESEFEVVPSISPSITSGAPGEKLSISGTGFGYKSDVSIVFRNTEVAYANTNQYGSFSVEFHVPDIKAGIYEIRAVDEDDNLDQTKFTVTAGAKLDKSVGAVGSELTISGSGFKPGGTITIKYDNIPVGTITADSSGDFTGNFFIPLSKGGQHSVSVSDGTIIRKMSFTVESTAPPIPTPLLPTEGTDTRAESYFDWSDVADPSKPIIYKLQIASDQNFANIVLEKGNLTVSEYMLTGEESLAAVTRESPYFWRIKAVDSASNESEWSIPRHFYVIPPAIAAPLLPVAGAKAASQAHLDWEDITSLSPPITYILQIATDPNFAFVVLEKDGIIESEYTLTEGEKLAAVKKEAPYYWRIKAVDDAANEGEWSEPLPFHVGFALALPGWGIAVLVIIGVFFVGLFAFWLGRKTTYNEGEIYP